MNERIKRIQCARWKEERENAIACVYAAIQQLIAAMEWHSHNRPALAGIEGALISAEGCLKYLKEQFSPNAADLGDD